MRLSRGRKFTNKRQKLLLKNLATSLVMEEKITTTLPKAKELGPYIERLIHKAQSGALAERRVVIAKLNTETAARKLFDEISPRFSHRNSGFVSIKKAGFRLGDNAALATIELLDKPKVAVKVPNAKSSAVKSLKEAKTNAKN